MVQILRYTYIRTYWRARMAEWSIECTCEWFFRNVQGIGTVDEQSYNLSGKPIAEMTRLDMQLRAVWIFKQTESENRISTLGEVSRADSRGWKHKSAASVRRVSRCPTICGRWYRGAPVSGTAGGAAERAGIPSSFQQADRESKPRSLRLDAQLLLHE